MIQRKSHHSPKSPERQKDAEATETPKIDLANRMALSIPEMAEVLNIAAPVAYEISSQEDFPAFYIGHHKLVSKQGLQRWIDERCKGVAVPMPDRKNA